MVKGQESLEKLSSDYMPSHNEGTLLKAMKKNLPEQLFFVGEQRVRSLILLPRLNLQSPCLSLLSAGMISVHHVHG